MTGIDTPCNFKCKLYKNFKNRNNDLIAANLPKSQRGVYNKWSREYFEQQKIYIFEQELYQISDNVARKMSPEEIAVIKNDFKVWLGDEYNDPKLIEKDDE